MVAYLPQETIRKKRNGEKLDREEIEQFVSGITSEMVTEGQIAALAMAVYFNGMEQAEAVALTEAMRDSGDVLDWSDLDGPILDKHSTGGVGDNVSLMLAPALAACGAFVPMISGRGLGHTGGTLDKLDSIPGYQTQPDNALFRKVTSKVGCAIIGQTGNLAPADKRFYGIRDVTATVESVPLICASILSKKLAAGLQGLVLDVKCGNGAFMDDQSKASELAEWLTRIAAGAGLPARAVLTDMNQPLASAAGNGVEVQNAVDFLTGRLVDSRLYDVTVELGAHLLSLSPLAEDASKGREMMVEAIGSGVAAETFAKMVSALGGPTDFIEKPERYLPKAPIIRAVTATEAGSVSNIDSRAVGVAVVALGGGRVRAQDNVDHAVGVTDLIALGDALEEGDPLAIIHARDEASANAASDAIRASITLGEARSVEMPHQIIDVIG